MTKIVKSPLYEERVNVDKHRLAWNIISVWQFFDKKPLPDLADILNAVSTDQELEKVKKILLKIANQCIAAAKLTPDKERRIALARLGGSIKHTFEAGDRING